MKLTNSGREVVDKEGTEYKVLEYCCDYIKNLNISAKGDGEIFVVTI